MARIEVDDTMATRRSLGRVNYVLVITFLALMVETEADIIFPEGVRMTSLNMTTDTQEVILGESHNITVDLFVYHTHGDVTSHVIRNYRWAVEMWVSQHPQGEGEKIARTKQMLSSIQQRQNLYTNQQLTFTGLVYPLNLWSIPCSKIQYLCCSFKVRRKLTLNETGQITNCQEAPNCKDGIVVRDINFDYRPERSDYNLTPNGSPQKLLLNVRVFYDETVSGNITGGTPLWKILAWASTNIDGRGPRHSLRKNVLRPKESWKGLIVGQNLTFDRVNYTLDPSNLSCPQMTYVCVRFKMVAEKNYVILSRPNSSVRTECQLGLSCAVSTAGKDPGDFKNEGSPSTISGSNARRPSTIAMKISAGLFTSAPLDRSTMIEPGWPQTIDCSPSDDLNSRLTHSTPQSSTIKPNSTPKFTTTEINNKESPPQPSASARAPSLLQGKTVPVTQGAYRSRSEGISINSYSTQLVTSPKSNPTASPSTTMNQLRGLLESYGEITRHRDDIPRNNIDDVISILQKLSEIDDIPVEVAEEVILHTNDFMTAHILRSPNISSAHNTSQITEHLNNVMDNIQLGNDNNFQMNLHEVKVSTSDITPKNDSLQSFGQIYPLRSDDHVQSDRPIGIDSYDDLQKRLEVGFYLPKSAVPLPTSSGIESARVNFIVYRDSRLFDGAKSTLVASQVSDNNDECFVCSQVLSLDVKVNGKRVTSLHQPASLAFNISQAPSMFSRQCVWWDFGSNGGYGDWSTEGCHVTMETEDNIICDCDHLTNFAVLMSPDYGCKAFMLDIISKIGCAISMGALVITLCTYLKFKKLMPPTAQLVLIQWIFALLCLYTIFLFGIDAVKSALTCFLVSLSLHYFTLSYMCWTSVEAVHMYIVLVQVMNGLPRARKFIPWSSLYAWGAPLCVVAGSYLTRGKELYSNRDYCFLRRDFNFFVFLLAPIAAILCFNVLCFLVIMYRINFRRPKVTMMPRDRRKLDAVTIKVKQAMTVAILVGATWILGFFAIGDGGYLFALLFCVLNSLTGVFVFFVFCLFRKEVRGKWGATNLCGCCFTTRDTLGGVESSRVYSRSSTVKSHSITLEFMPRAMILDLNSPTISESLESPLSDKRDLL